MPRVSLILLRSPGTAWPAARVLAWQSGLEGRGFSVDLLVVADPSATNPAHDLDPSCRVIFADPPGLANSAVAGLRAATGELLVVLDLALAYAVEDVVAVVEKLAADEAELVVAARRKPLTGAVAGRILGTTDPTSGLLGLTRAAAVEADDSLAPVGSRFGLELLARVAGRRVDVPVVGPVAGSPRVSTPLDDLRQLKRLADDRFGNASRLLQFCFVGASGMVVDLSFYAGFQALIARLALFEGRTTPIVGGPLAPAVAAVGSIAIALSWNFTINRRLTFNDARCGSIPRQFLRYVLSNLLGIAVSLTLRLILPNTFGFFRDHRLAAALVGIVAATGISFSMARWFVFGQKAAADDDKPAPMPRRRIDGFRSISKSSPSRVSAGHLERS
jgi:dolichol-phosphate mannosyltransferase